MVPFLLYLGPCLASGINQSLDQVPFHGTPGLYLALGTLHQAFAFGNIVLDPGHYMMALALVLALSLYLATLGLSPALGLLGLTLVCGTQGGLIILYDLAWL